MGRKKELFLVLDTETATLPFANEIAGGNAEIKKKIAIARPLIYDFSYVICDRYGEIYDRKQFLIAETFSVPAIFDTAYYKNKKPIYLEMLKQGETVVRPWNEVMTIFEDDLQLVKAVGAYNAMFDFKKAIAFTELYISKLYSADFYSWEKLQYQLCERIATQPYKKTKDDFDPEFFNFRGNDYLMFDIWGLACERLLNTNAYRNKCLEYGMLTNSGDYFKSSAEASYRHLCEKYDFEEAHTALNDAEIETFILAKCLRKKGMRYGIDYFPFRALGHPTEYVESIKGKEKKAKYANIVYQFIYNYLGDDWEDEELTGYRKGMKNKAERLAKLF